MGRGIKAGKTKKKKSGLDLSLRLDQERLANDINEAIKGEVTEMIMYQHNIDMLAVMFALRDEFKFGKDRLIRTLKKASEHATNMFHEGVSVDEMLVILEEETGVTETDLVFKPEVGVRY